MRREGESIGGLSGLTLFALILPTEGGGGGGGACSMAVTAELNS